MDGQQIENKIIKLLKKIPYLKQIPWGEFDPLDDHESRMEMIAWALLGLSVAAILVFAYNLISVVAKAL